MYLGQLALQGSWDQEAKIAQIFEWQGMSGEWYPHSILPFSRYPYMSGRANYVFVRRNPSGSVTPIYIGQTTDLQSRMREHEKFDAALRLGANELHVHSLARTVPDLFRIESDLRNGHVTLINEQPSKLGELLASRLREI